MRFVLSDGRVVEPNRGILGLTEDGVLTEGYDTVVDYPGSAEWDDDYTPISAEDKRVIAEAVIARWKRWAGL